MESSFSPAQLDEIRKISLARWAGGGRGKGGLEGEVLAGFECYYTIAALLNANVPDVIQERTHPGRAIRTMFRTTCKFFKHFDWSISARFVTRMDISMK